MANVSCVTFHFVLKALEKTTNISISEMLNQIGLKIEDLEKQDGKINSDKLSQVFRFCMQKSNNPTLALDLGQAASYHSLGLLGYLLLNTKNLKEMLEKFNIYQKLISGYLKFHFNDDGTYYKLSIYINENPMIPVPPFHAQVHLSSILSILTQILGEKVIPAYTCFSFKKDGNILEYQKIFGENISFEKYENAVFFKKNELEIPVKNSNISMLAFFENQAKTILNEQEERSWYFKVEKEILKNIGDKELTIELISQNLHTTPRTLQNYLKSELKTFRQALANVRQKLAQYYMHNTKMDYSSISLLLGYSEPSSFFRAYKKWNSKTPNESKNS